MHGSCTTDGTCSNRHWKMLLSVYAVHVWCFETWKHCGNVYHCIAMFHASILRMFYAQRMFCVHKTAEICCSIEQGMKDINKQLKKNKLKMHLYDDKW